MAQTPNQNFSPKTLKPFLLPCNKFTFTPDQDSSVRRKGTYNHDAHPDPIQVLLEPTNIHTLTSGPGLRGFRALQILPDPTTINRPEEVRVPTFMGLVASPSPNPNDEEGGQIAVVYEMPTESITLAELLTTSKPSGNVRAVLGGVIATQIRSLHVHYQMKHLALRTSSFVFRGTWEEDYHPSPYLLDWARPFTPSIYTHPQQVPNKPSFWWYDVWSLLIILSEIAEWKQVDGWFRDADDLVKKKKERRAEVCRDEWKGEKIAKVMRYGFEFLEKDHEVLLRLNRKAIKEFFDQLCWFIEE